MHRTSRSREPIPSKPPQREFLRLFELRDGVHLDLDDGEVTTSSLNDEDPWLWLAWQRQRQQNGKKAFGWLTLSEAEFVLDMTPRRACRYLHQLQKKHGDVLMRVERWTIVSCAALLHVIDPKMLKI